MRGSRRSSSAACRGPGELPDSVTVSVARGVLVVVTTPVNEDVARCLFDCNEKKLRPLLSFEVRGEVTKKIQAIHAADVRYRAHESSRASRQ